MALLTFSLISNVFVGAEGRVETGTALVCLSFEAAGAILLLYIVKSISTCSNICYLRFNC